MSKHEINISLEQVPLECETQKKQVRVPARVTETLTTTVGEIAESQGISLKGKNAYVNGQPAKGDTVVGKDDTVRFTERPKSS